MEDFCISSWVACKFFLEVFYNIEEEYKGGVNELVLWYDKAVKIFEHVMKLNTLLR